MKMDILTARSYTTYASRLAMLILFSGLILACSSQKDYVIEHDYSYRGNFSKYKTFSFMREPGADSSSFNPIVEKTIVSRLQAQGFRPVEKNPDMLITYKLFYAQVRYQGYDQPHFDLWLNKNGIPVIDYEKDTLVSGRLKEQYNDKKYTIEDGMMLILVIDRKRAETVWQGYTSGIAAYNAPGATTSLVRATSKVMDQFRIVVQDYLIN